MKAVRNPLEKPRAFDAVVTLLTAGIVLSAYVDAYAHVKVPGRVIHNLAGIDPASAALAAVTVCWFLLTGFLFLSFGQGLRQGRPWNRALPDGYTGSLAAALVFGAALIVDSALAPVGATLVVGSALAPAVSNDTTLGLDLLFTPAHVVEIAAAAVMVSGPLRSAARRGESTAGVVTLISAALLLSVFTFATQFVHPLIDPWSSSDPQQVPAKVETWVAQNLGVSGLLIQATILAGTGLLLNSGFKLRPGSLTLVFTINGFLVTITKTHFYLLPVNVAAGVVGDAWLAWSARRAGRPSASLCAVIAGAFTVADLIAVELFGGTSWRPSLWAGVIIATTMICWMLGRLLRAGLPGAPLAAPAQLAALPLEVRWTRDPQSTIRPQLVRAALDDLGTPEALGRSPLGQLPGISRGGSAAADLRSVLVDVIGELAASPDPRDGEAGRLLLDYYVKRVGSHEVIMERLHLSRPTFYRRLQRGFALVAERLDELSEFAQRVQVSD